MKIYEYVEISQHTLEQPVSQRINQKNIKISRTKMKIYQTICDIAKQYPKGKFHCKKSTLKRKN